jgi:superfamily II DNA or RNA helicase
MLFTNPSAAEPLELWPHQQVALDKLRVSIASGKRHPLVQAPTGFGKTP